jgi:SsrA-binding protein
MFVNKKAKFEYEFIRTEVAGIQLYGSEVKSISSGKMTMSESYCVFIGNELFVKNIHITENGTAYTHEPIRDRKLLLKRRELNKLKKDLVKGLTIVPYKIFKNSRGLYKIEVVLARGKNLYDKRQTIKDRDIKNEIRVISNLKDL